MKAEDLNHKLYDQPFRPFRIHLSDGSHIPITNAGIILVGESSAIVPTELGRDSDGHPLVLRWHTVALSNMVQFSDGDEPIAGKRPKKRGWSGSRHSMAVPL